MLLPLAHLLRRPTFQVICLGAILAGGATAEEPAGTPAEEEITQIQLNVVPIKSEARPASGYYIGIACEPISQELAQKLKLEPGRGLLIETVLPNSPAAKAGLKSDDVIVAHGDKHLATMEQLADAVAQTKDGVLKLTILRGGEKQAVEVRPAKRQAEAGIAIAPEGDEKSDKVKAQLEKQLDALRRAAAKEAAAKEPAPGPVLPKPAAPASPWKGAAAPPGASMPGGPMPGATPRVVVAMAHAPGGRNLPDDMKVTIHKAGKEPATVIVEQGQKLWKTTEKELEMLPAEAREYASHLLGRPAEGIRARMMMGGMGGGAGMAPGAMMLPAMPGASWGGGSGFGTSGGAGFPGASGGAGSFPARFEFKLEEPKGKNPAGDKPGPAPMIKQLPGGGLQIEIRETEEKNPAAEPKAEGARVIREKDGRIEIELRAVEEKEPAAPPAVRWIELKRPEAKPAEAPAPKKPETELRELEQKVRELRRQLEELRKEAGERR